VHRQARRTGLRRIAARRRRSAGGEAGEPLAVRVGLATPDESADFRLVKTPLLLLRPSSVGFVLAVLVASSARVDARKFPDLAATPPMGWNTWNTFGSEINEALIEETADAMAANGMRDAGYVYIVLDDAWSAMERDGDDRLTAHPERFPSGMKALGDYLHARGFKFGIYNCAGTQTCAGYPGGWGHEFEDARTYASWGVDYLKYDWCNTGTANAPDAYRRMSAALFAAGRPVVFSICDWGDSRPWEWAGEAGHLWRTTGDITDCYDCRRVGSVGWKVILDMQVAHVPLRPGVDNGIGRFSGPGRWNDPDMLEVGNHGLTFEESRAHFTLWCMIAAPLIAGNDVRTMTPEILALMTNREAIAIDQDPLGRQGWRYHIDSTREIWVRELAGGDWAVCLLNLDDEPAELTIPLNIMWFLPREATVRDVWAGKDLGAKPVSIVRTVGPHGVVLLRLDAAAP
jgi:alpha-galactosidase